MYLLCEQDRQDGPEVRRCDLQNVLFNTALSLHDIRVS
jgi:hypothetical protein